MRGLTLTILIYLLIEKGNGLNFSLPRLPTLPQSPSTELTTEEQKQPHMAGSQGMRVCEVCYFRLQSKVFRKRSAQVVSTSTHIARIVFL